MFFKLVSALRNKFEPEKGRGLIRFCASAVGWLGEAGSDVGNVYPEGGGGGQVEHTHQDPTLVSLGYHMAHLGYNMAV